MVTKKKKKREWDRLAKRRERERKGPEAIRAKRIEDRALCIDSDYLASQVARQWNGCWIWLGPVEQMFHTVRPMARRGQASVSARQAVWEAFHGKRPKYRAWVRARCGNKLCVAPEHLYETNATLEAALQSGVVAPASEVVLDSADNGVREAKPFTRREMAQPGAEVEGEVNLNHVLGSLVDPLHHALPAGLGTPGWGYFSFGKPDVDFTCHEVGGLGGQGPDGGPGMLASGLHGSRFTHWNTCSP